MMYRATIEVKGKWISMPRVFLSPNVPLFPVGETRHFCRRLIAICPLNLQRHSVHNGTHKSSSHTSIYILRLRYDLVPESYLHLDRIFAKVNLRILPLVFSQLFNFSNSNLQQICLLKDVQQKQCKRRWVFVFLSCQIKMRETNL